MRKSAKLEFKAKLRDSGGSGVYVEPPFDVSDTFGQRGRIKIKATFDGEPYRGSLFPYGGKYTLGVLKAIREKIGKGIGDTVKVTLMEDEEERTVEIPADLQKALNKNKDAKAIFEKFAYTHRREYVMWIKGAKREETRARRIAKAVEMIAAGHKEAWAIRLGEDTSKTARERTKR
jgi:hypothetical protein